MLYTTDLDAVGEIPAGTWLIERNRKTRDDGGCEKRWVTVKYTEGLAKVLQVPGAPQALYFCDSSLEEDPEKEKHVARPFYNFRTLLGGTASVKNNGRALFREVKDRHRPLLESLRRDIQSGRVQSRVQVNIAGTTLRSDTLTVVQRGIRIPMGTKVEQSAGEQRATFNWSGTGVIEDHAPDYANIPGRSETTTAKTSVPAGSDDSFPWWALALTGVLSALTGILGLFLYWERKRKKALRTKEERLREKLDSQRRERTRGPGRVIDAIKSLRKAQENEFQSLREEVSETSDQRVKPAAIKKLSRAIEVLISRLEDREASGDEDKEGKHLLLPIAELQVNAPSSPLPLKPGKQDTGRTGGRRKEDIGSTEWDEQEEASSPDTQTDARDSVPQARSPEDGEQELEEEGSPIEVDSDFISVLKKCNYLSFRYNFEKNDPGN